MALNCGEITHSCLLCSVLAIDMKEAAFIIEIFAGNIGYKYKNILYPLVSHKNARSCDSSLKRRFI